VKNVVEWSLLLIVTGSALAFGGVQTPAYCAMGAAIFLLLFLVLAQQTLRGRIDLPLPLWALPFFAWVLLEIVPLPAAAVSFLSPHRLLPALEAALGPAASRWTTLSLYPHDTRLMLFKLAAYLAAFTLAAYAFEARGPRRILPRGLIVMGLIEASYGIIQYLTGYQKIFGFAKQVYVFDATGTYINHNHFAGCLELVLPFAVTMVFYNLQAQPAGGFSYPRAHGSSASSRYPRVFFYAGIVILLLIAVVFSRSRMGLFSVLVSLIVMALLGQTGGGRRAWLVVTLLVIACAMTYAAWIGVAPVINRFQALAPSGFEDPYGRVVIWKQASGIIKDYPAVGTGLGTFGVAFRRFQTSTLELFVDHAHNDYLELATDTGIPGALLLFVPIIALLVRMIVAYRKARDDYRRSVLLGCIGGTTALLIHSAMDFNLQIPANALLFAVILGTGAKATLSSAVPRRTPSAPEIARL